MAKELQDRKRITLAAVNVEFAKRGIQAVLMKGGGYFYFQSKEAAVWLDRTVRVPKISDLSLEEWIGEYQRLKKLHAEIRRTAKKR